MIKSYITYTLTAFLSLFILSSAAHSQSTTSDEVSGTQLRAIAIGLQNNLRELHLLDSSMQSTGKLSLRKLAFSREFTSPIVEGQLIFGIPNGVDEDGEPLYKPVASVPWKASNRQACLFFIPKSLVGKNQGTKEYAIQVLDMSRKFKPGHTVVMNFTPLDTMVRMGEHKTVIKGWAKDSFSEVADVDEMNMAQIQVYYKHNNTVYNPFNAPIRYLGNIRYITLIYPDIKNRRMAVNIVKDYGKLYD